MTPKKGGDLGEEGNESSRKNIQRAAISRPSRNPSPCILGMIMREALGKGEKHSYEGPSYAIVRMSREKKKGGFRYTGRNGKPGIRARNAGPGQPEKWPWRGGKKLSELKGPG